MLNQIVDSGKPFDKRISDTQQTTFSLDAAARLMCNTFEEVNQAQRDGGWQFDAIIIGSGMYGGYTASKVFQFTKTFPSNRRPRVLVLEAGPYLISEHIQNLSRGIYAIEPLVNKPIVPENQSFLTQIDRPAGQPLQGMSPHHRCVGGKSLFWGGWSPRLTDEDLARLDENGGRLWPQHVVDFLKSPDGYDFIERQIGVTPTADFINGDFNEALKTRLKDIVSGKEVPALTGVVEAPIAVQAETPESGLFSMDKFSTVPLLFDSIRQDAEASRNFDGNRFLFLVPNAEVLKLETSQGCVTQVVILIKEPSSDSNVPGLRERVVRLDLKQGTMVFLAGNAVNSTRLALNSFPSAGITGRELMGKNLMAHTRGNYFWRINRKALGINNDIKKFSTAALHVTGAHPVMLQDVGATKGQFHFIFFAVGSLGADPGKNLFKFIPHLDDIQTTQEAIDSTNIDDWIVFANLTCGEMFGNRNADIEKRNSSFISVNPFGGSGDDVYVENGRQLRIPKVFLCLVQTAQDQSVRDAQKVAAFELIAALAGAERDEIINRSNNEKVQFISGNEDPIGSTYHESGTLWMGEDPFNSVTDLHGHFHHVTNAFCLDQSLFPTVGSANPVATGLSLNQMIARHIASRFTSNGMQPLEEGFECIFDGTLKGWKFFGNGRIDALPGLNILEAGTASIEDQLGFLRLENKKYQNFILRLDWKAFTIQANSGIFLRMPDMNGTDFDTLFRQAVEIQIDEIGKLSGSNQDGPVIYGSSLHKTGAIYNLAPATQWASKVLSSHNDEGFWNRFEIRVQDADIQVALNGTLVSRATLTEPFLSAGYIAIQCHTDVVQFRNIRIQEL